MVDIDGVISLFGFDRSGAQAHSPEGRASEGLVGRRARPDGTFHSIDGIPHFLSSTAAAHLLALASVFDLVWASGWEEKAEEYLPRLLGLPAGLPFLRFERRAGTGARTGTGAGSSMNAHWKLDAVDAHAADRPLAWIDDAFDESCHAWSAARSASTLLVQTAPSYGLTAREASLLETWARELVDNEAGLR